MRLVSSPSGKLLSMSRATSLPPARPLAGLATVALIAVAAVLALGAGSAQAAKPCWERVMDDWTENGSIDGKYSARCIQTAKRKVPEDIRTYTDILDKLDAYLQAMRGDRIPQSTGGSGEPISPMERPSRNEGTGPRVTPEDEGPLKKALNNDTTDASSIPLPLIVLAALALLLMAAGGAGFAHRKLQARRISNR
jgi:hypothetical protein